MQVNERISKFRVLEKVCRGEFYKLLEDGVYVFRLFVQFQGAETFCRACTTSGNTNQSLRVRDRSSPAFIFSSKWLQAIFSKCPVEKCYTIGMI